MTLTNEHPPFIEYKDEWMNEWMNECLTTPQHENRSAIGCQNKVDAWNGYRGWRKGGNILFNDALNTLYLRLYGVRHMVKDHMGYSFRLAAKILLYASSHRQDNTYHGLCYTSRGALAGTRNSSMGPLWRIDLTTHRTMSYISLRVQGCFTDTSSSYRNWRKWKEMFYLTTHSTHFITETEQRTTRNVNTHCCPYQANTVEGVEWLSFSLCNPSQAIFNIVVSVALYIGVKNIWWGFCVYFFVVVGFF